MSLPHAMLVSLAEQPASGYDLVRRFDKSVGYFWRASHQQIYRELPKLADRGWAHATDVAQAGRPDKRVYTITDAGRDELTRWLGEPSGPEAVRERLLVKVRGAATVGAAGVIDEIRRHRDEHADKLVLFRDIQARDFADGPGEAESTRCLYLALRSGLLYHASWVDWCDEALGLLATDTPRSSGAVAR